MMENIKEVHVQQGLVRHPYAIGGKNVRGVNYAQISVEEITRLRDGKDRPCFMMKHKNGGLTLVEVMSGTVIVEME